MFNSIPNLLDATRNYWRKLDELELAYQQGKVSLEEVDARVNELMRELAQERRAAIAYFWQGGQQWLRLNRELLAGMLILMSAAYVWLSTVRIS